MATVVVTVGSTTIYDTEAIVQTSLVPIVTTQTLPDSTSTSTTEGGNTFYSTTTSNGVVSTVTLADSFIAISLIVVPGGTFTSTIGYNTRFVTSFEQRAVSTVPILSTSIIAVNTPASTPAFVSGSSAGSSLSSLASSAFSSSASSLVSLSPSRSTFTSSASSRSASETSSATLATATGAAARSAKHISSGAIAGIAVGVVLGIAVVAIALFFLLRRSRRRRRLGGTPSASHDFHAATSGIGGKPELAGDGLGLAANKQTSNVYTTIVKPELDANNTSTDSRRSPGFAAPLIHEAPFHTNRAPRSTAVVPSRQPVSSEKQALQSEHYRHTYPEAATDQQLRPPTQQPYRGVSATAADSHRPVSEQTSPKYFVNGPDPGIDAPPGSRAFHQGQRLPTGNGATPEIPPDSLSRLRAEHEALMERIRAAEERERDR